MTGDEMTLVLQTLLDGFLVTLSLLAISGLGAFILGTIIAILRISPVSTLRGFAAFYTEAIRNIPLTLVLFFCATLLPQLGVDFARTFGASTHYYILAAIGLSVYTSPFIAEAIRSGVNGVPFGQAEAARSIGLDFGQTLSLVIMPQAFRMTIPPLINVFIALTKNTSVAGGFAVIELFARGRDLVRDFGNYAIPMLLGVAICYLLVTIPLGYVSRVIERKVAVLR